MKKIFTREVYLLNLTFSHFRFLMIDNTDTLSIKLIGHKR